MKLKNLNKNLKRSSKQEQNKIRKFLFYWVISIIFSFAVASELIFHPPITFRSVSVILIGLSLTVGLVASVLIVEIGKLVVKGFKENNYIFLIVFFLIIAWLFRTFSEIAG